MVTKDDKLFEKIAEETKNIYGDNLKAVILYGSVARGDAKEDSDVDIAILISHDDRDMYDKLLDSYVNYELEYNLVISAVLIEWEQFNKWKNTLPFYKNIIREGIQLWTAA